MEWFVFAVLASATWALNIVLNKILVDKKFSSPFTYAIFLTSMDTVFIALIYLFFPVASPFPYLLLAIFTGAMNMFTFWFFCMSMKSEEISRVSALMQMIPIFTVILSAVFLSELLGLRQYLGIVMIVFASMMISYRRVEGRIKMSGALKYIVIFTLGSAIYNIILKFLLGYMDFWTFFFWNLTGIVLTVPFLLSVSRIRKDFLHVVRRIDKRIFLVGLGGETLFVLGNIFFLDAVSTGYVSLVSATMSLEPFFVLLYTIILSIFIPRLLKEEVNKQTVILKFLAIAFMAIALFLINL